MPYRRLPNTDSARHRALKTALERGRDLPPFKLAYSQESLQRLRGFFSEYERSFIQLKESARAQIADNKKYLGSLQKAKTYISHFIQVMNFAIMRGELPEKARTFYGIEEKDRKVPPLNTEAEVLMWGENIIKGEPQRIAKGGNPVTNPTIAVVRVHFDHFMDAVRLQNTLKEHYNRASDKVGAMRTDADQIILNIWNEVEAFFGNLPDDEKRIKAEEYGLVYFFRKNEKENGSVDENGEQDEGGEDENNDISMEDEMKESEEETDIPKKEKKRKGKKSGTMQYSLLF